MAGERVKRPRTRAEVIEALHRSVRRHSTVTVLFHGAIASRLGLNPSDHKCADLLLTLGPMTAGELATRTGLTTAAITAVVDRLEGFGFVRRERDPEDRRRVIVTPTPTELEKRIVPLFRGIAAATDELLATYTVGELALLLDFLERSTAMAEREITRVQE